MSNYYLNPGLPQPVATELDEPFWSGLRENVVRVQQCQSCQGYQWGPEWICHHCHSDQMSYVEVADTGVIYSYERIWHPVHPALSEQGPYIVVLVTLPHAGDIRLVGNLLGDAQQDVIIGSQVKAVYEHHDDVDNPFTLLQWSTL